MRISAVIITLNEERNIIRCLDSVAEIADEILVIDSFSTDKTEAICLEKGVKFLKNNWPGYGAQKNFGNQQASNDWILSLDADEALSLDLRTSIAELKNNPVTADAYSMNRLTNYCGHWIKHCGWYPDVKTRLFDRRKGSWDLELVHENLTMNAGSTIGFLKGDILHFSFYSRQEHLRQVEHYSGLVACQFYNKGKRTNLVKVLFSGPVRFIRDYFFRLGILDGKAGLNVCLLSAKAARLKYSKLRKLNSNGKNISDQPH